MPKLRGRASKQPLQRTRNSSVQLTQVAVWVFTGLPASGTALGFDVGCDALSLDFPDVCRGGVAVSNFGTTDGGLCNVFGLETADWQQVSTRSLRVKLNCQAVEE